MVSRPLRNSQHLQRNAVWCRAITFDDLHVWQELRAFSSEVDTGSREENASKQKDRARL
jgi:hypothetical protein